MSPERQNVLNEIAQAEKQHQFNRWRLLHFSMFARNGTWGTCADCPRDALGMTYPEGCPHFKREDHRYTLAHLTLQYDKRNPS